MADLAFLIGMSTGALEAAIRRCELFVPTRGMIMDIGPGVTHRAEIVRLYVEGYTEPEIVRRTQHTYDSVASRYLRGIGSSRAARAPSSGSRFAAGRCAPGAAGW